MATDAGFAECGLPNTPERSSSRWLCELRFAVQRPAGVVEVDLALLIDARVFDGAKDVESGRFLVARVLRQEIAVGLLDG